jgi:hypothetical protein
VLFRIVNDLVDGAEANIAFRMKLVHAILKQRVHSKHKLSESQMLLSATLGKFMRWTVLQWDITSVVAKNVTHHSSIDMFVFL